MNSPGLSFNLMDQLTFYGSYHTRPGNQVIHFVFVPLIHWTITVWLAYAPAPLPYDLPAHLDFLPQALSRCALWAISPPSFTTISGSTWLYCLTGLHLQSAHPELCECCFTYLGAASCHATMPARHMP